VIRHLLTKVSICKLDLHGGDFVLVQLRGDRTPEQLELMRSYFAERLPEGVHAIVMDDSVTMQVLRPVSA
jgi:hypothetical protein